MYALVRVQMDNDAFTDASFEFARILRELADRLEGHPHFSPGHCQSLQDYNGNSVGWFDVKDGDYPID